MLVRVRRGGSRGFMLHEESLDDQFLRESLQQEREWIDKFRNKKSGALSRVDTSNSSKFSFSTEYSSGMPTYSISTAQVCQYTVSAQLRYANIQFQYSSGMPTYNKLYTAKGCTCHSDRKYLVLTSWNFNDIFLLLSTTLLKSEHKCIQYNFHAC